MAYLFEEVEDFEQERKHKLNQENLCMMPSQLPTPSQYQPKLPNLGPIIGSEALPTRINTMQKVPPPKKLPTPTPHPMPRQSSAKPTEKQSQRKPKLEIV